MDNQAPQADLLATVRAEAVVQILRNLPVAASVNLLNATATCWVLAQAEPVWPGPAVWLASVWIIVAARLVLWRLGASGTWRILTNEQLAILGSLTTGLAWGVGSALLLPPGPTYRLFIAFVVGGMCAGSVSTSGQHFPSLASFVLTAAVPLACRFFIEGGRPEMVMGLMTLLFAATLLMTGWYFSETFAERTRLQVQLDATNRKLRQEVEEHRATGVSLRQAQRLEAIGRLTAGIAHDFNNLLMTIGGNVEILRRLPITPTVAQKLDAIERAIERGRQSTRRLLAFGRNKSVSPEKIDLNTRLAELTPLLRDTLGDKIAVDFEPQANLWPVFADPGQIEHVLLNLAINARDAMSEGGRITISTRNVTAAPSAVLAELGPGELVELAVTDTGIGMPAQVLQRAAEPFFSTKPRSEGSGLGLSQVHGVARQSGGTILIESAPEKGTVVRVFLPRAAAVAESSRAAGAL